MVESRPDFWRGRLFHGLFAASLSLLAAGNLGVGDLRAQDDAATVDAYLGRLGLVELQLRLHEQRLDSQKSASDRTATARRLADLYASALLAADDPNRADGLRRRIERLLEQFPDVGTGALQVSLAQAEYQRAEKLVLAWLEDPRAETSKTEAGKILERVVPLLDRHHATLRDAADKRFEELERIKNEIARAEREVELQREQAVVARAAYLSAWAHYYAGLCAIPTPLAEPHFQAARREFRAVLGLEDTKDYAEINADTLGLEPLARSRAVVGLGLSEAALAQAVESDLVFRWLAGGTVHPTIREQADYWRLQSRLNVRRWQEAADIAAERAPTLNPPATPGKVSFLVSLVRTAYVAAPPETFGGAARSDSAFPDAPTRQKLGDLGMQGLLRLRQIGLLRELVTKFDIPIDAQAPLPLVWARGEQLFRDAEQTRDSAKYDAAAKLLEAGLARPAANSDVATAGRCRWTLAWCHYRRERFEAAGKLFQAAAASLREIDAKTAVEAAWMSFAAYQHLLADQPKFRSAAIEALTSLQRDFPGTPRAQQAGLQLARLQQSAESPEEALRTLAKIPATDPQYAAATYEISRLEHQLWVKAGKPPGARGAGLKVIEAVDRCLAPKAGGGATTPEDDERLLRAGLLAIEVVAADETASATPVLASRLETLEPRAKRVPATSSALAEYHYRRLQLAQRSSDESRAQTEADWLTRNASGSSFELPAVVLRARRLDEQIAKAGPDELPALEREAVRLYSRLVALWGDSPDALRDKKNTLIANSKLANYLYATGQYAEAVERYRKLLAVHPQDKALLRRAALAEQKAGRPADALDRWRTLLAGVERGSSDWFEAKLGQLECLAETEPAKGAEVFAQFRLLYPELGPAPWHARFQQLARKLESARGTP